MKQISDSDYQTIIRVAPIIHKAIYAARTGNRERNAADLLKRISNKLKK